MHFFSSCRKNKHIPRSDRVDEEPAEVPVTLKSDVGLIDHFRTGGRFLLRTLHFSIAMLSFGQFDPSRAFSPSIHADLRVENPNQRVGFAYWSSESVAVYQRGARLYEATVLPMAMSGPEMRLGKEAEGECRTGDVVVEMEIRVLAGRRRGAVVVGRRRRSGGRIWCV